jgi:hypothetical protein
MAKFSSFLLTTVIALSGTLGLTQSAFAADGGNGALRAADLKAYPPGLADGSGIWVNLWNYPTANFDDYAQNLYATGVRNLFIQTSRSNTVAITQPLELGQIIESCHKYKIRVIAWSFAELHNPRADANKLIEAARFRTPSGERLDAIAPNLEKNLHKEAVEAYSQALRDALGAGYPMVAVVYSPLNRAPQVAITPWKTLDRYYDVIAPMAYWNGRYQTIDAYTYTRKTVERIRELTGRPDVEVHVIGDGMGTGASEIREFLRACGDVGAQTASLYPNQKTTAEQFTALSLYDDYMPTNSRQRLSVLRDLMSKGVVKSGRFDPTRALSRGEFFDITAAALRLPNTAAQSQSGFELLASRGVFEALAGECPGFGSQSELTSPISLEEGKRFALAAKQVLSSPAQRRRGSKNKAPSYLTMNKPSRADRLFAAPAFAENRNSSSGSSKNLNYLDAAEIYTDIAR